MRPRGRKQVDSRRAGDAQAVRNAAIALLARRDFASFELSHRLASRGYDAALVAATLAELAAERIIDDARFCENFVAYQANRGQGPLRIGADLKSLGLPGELIDQGLAGHPDWRARAQAVRSRRFGRRGAAVLAGQGAAGPLFAVPGLFSGSYPRRPRHRL